MGWREQNGFLERTFRFGSFKNAVVFITRAAELAAGVEHHASRKFSVHVVRVRVHLPGDRQRIRKAGHCPQEMIDMIYSDIRDINHAS
jgi:hypothetical protein